MQPCAFCVHHRLILSNMDDLYPRGCGRGFYRAGRAGSERSGAPRGASLAVLSLDRHSVRLHVMGGLLSMSNTPPDVARKIIGGLLRLTVIGGAVIASLMVVYDTDKEPRTDDASVRANFIAIAPEVGGRLTKLPVKDNAFVKK